MLSAGSRHGAFLSLQRGLSCRAQRGILVPAATPRPCTGWPCDGVLMRPKADQPC